MDAVLQELGQGIEPADRALWGTTALVPVMAKARTACHNGFRAHLAGGRLYWMFWIVSVYPIYKSSITTCFVARAIVFT